MSELSTGKLVAITVGIGLTAWIVSAAIRSAQASTSQSLQPSQAPAQLPAEKKPVIAKASTTRTVGGLPMSYGGYLPGRG